MTELLHALQAAQRSPPAAKPLRVLTIGGGGPLGSAVLEALLAQTAGAAVGIAVRQAMTPTLRGLQAVLLEPQALHDFAPQVAVVVFDRTRRANGRDEAFVRPDPETLPSLAQQLHAAGVRQLLVALPHTPAMLPQALLHGLANLNEGAVAALGFSHVVFMRMARSGSDLDSAGPRQSPLQGLANWVLRQMQWMVPAAEQPVRVPVVAAVLADLACRLPHAAEATRVLPPALLWHAAQGAHIPTLLTGWLAGHPLPPRAGRAMRL